MKPSRLIESILFVLGEPLTMKRLSQILAISIEEIETALRELELDLKGRGIRLMRINDTVGLLTAPEASDIVSKVIHEEFSGDLTKTALETLAIVVYKGPISRSDIDYIRGVNSSFSIRNLLIRGLVERIPNPKDSRVFFYRPTFDLLKFFGVGKVEDIPEHSVFQKQMEDYLSKEPSQEEKEQNKKGD